MKMTMKILAVVAACWLVHAEGAAVNSNAKQLFQVQGSKASFDALLKSPVRQNAGLDIWRIRREKEHVEMTKDTTLVADVFAKRADVQKLLRRDVDVSFKQGVVKGVMHKHAKWHFAVKQLTIEDASEETMVANDRRDVAECRNRTQGFMTKLSKLDKYTKSEFFDCFRPDTEVFAFLDALVEANPKMLTKISNVSTTYEGKSIHAYKISMPSASRLLEEHNKKLLYTQALMHAREWQAGAATFYVMTALLDGLRAKEDSAVKIFKDFDWIFVPIVNIDGYEYSWSDDRYWRVNRHHSNGFDGVDLNRNFGPEEYFNLDATSVDSETNPGTAAYSEPETKGLLKFITGLKNLYGLVDMHSFGGMVLRPFSDVPTEAKDPYGKAIKTLGDNVAKVMDYTSEPGSYLYMAYGCFDDGMYRQFNMTVPAITIEVEGDDFTAPQSSIRKVGANNLRGLEQFAQETLKYAEAIA